MLVIVEKIYIKKGKNDGSLLVELLWRLDL